MLKILISLLFVKFLVAEEFKFQTHDLTQVISTIENKITAEMIDNDSLPYSEAKEIYDKINSEFEERKARFKNKLLKLSIDASYLNREIKERKDEIVSIENLIKRKSNKLEQLKADIKSEKED
jgi:peptidoglycan hydrolase CwlO-like protein